MLSTRSARTVQILAVAIAILFGLVTLFAGGRVLLGSDPGYIVFRPLLIYNTAMGVAYVGAGVIMWHSLARGRYAAGGIFLLNLLVLAAIVLVYRSGGDVAADSLRAMSVRTTVWLGLFLIAFWLVRSRNRA